MADSSRAAAFDQLGDERSQLLELVADKFTTLGLAQRSDHATGLATGDVPLRRLDGLGDRGHGLHDPILTAAAHQTDKPNGAGCIGQPTPDLLTW